MPKPGVADLCCPGVSSCCEPDLQLSKIDAATLAFWDNSEALPEGYEPPDGCTAEEVEALLKRYTRAICVAHETIASVVCMARYAAGCCIKLGICIETPCCCTCDCHACETCVRESKRLNKICVPRDRVKAVKLDGEDILDNDGPVSVEYCNGTWRLFGTKTGKFELCFELAGPTVLWEEAVRSYACDSVPCEHTKGCDRDEDTVIGLGRDGEDRAFVGDKFADRLQRDCCDGSGYCFGGVKSVETYMRWVECPPVEGG